MIEFRVRVRVRLQRATRPTVPETLSIQKAYQDDYGTAPTLVLAHLSIWNTDCNGNHSLHNGVIGLMVRLRVRVQRATRPTFPETLSMQKAYQDVYGTAKTLVLVQLSMWNTDGYINHSLNNAVIEVRVRVQRATRPTVPETLSMQKAYQDTTALHQNWSLHTFLSGSPTVMETIVSTME